MGLEQACCECKGVIRPREPRGCLRPRDKNLHSDMDCPSPLILCRTAGVIARELGRSSGSLAAEGLAACLCGLHGILDKSSLAAQERLSGEQYS